MALIAGIDFLRNNKSTWKAEEYSFVLLAGIFGGLIGAFNDQLTASISPDYFHFGKGIELHSTFRLEVAFLGGRAGFFVGFVIYGIYLISARSNRSCSSRFYVDLIQLLRLPLIYAYLLVPLLGLCFVGLRAHLETEAFMHLIPVSRIQAFFFVWGWHHALYIGALLGTVHAIIRIRKTSLSRIPA